MRSTLLAATALLATVAGGATPASAGAWCLWQNAYTYNCGFRTYAQCRASMAQASDYCKPNAWSDSRLPRHHRY